jgi:hypothetical protein
VKPKRSSLGDQILARVLPREGVEIGGEGAYPHQALILINESNFAAILNGAKGRRAPDGTFVPLVELITGDPLLAATPAAPGEETLFIGAAVAPRVAAEPRQPRPPGVSPEKWARLTTAQPPPKLRPSESALEKVASDMAAKAVELREKASQAEARAIEAERHAAIAAAASVDPNAQKALALRPRLQRAGNVLKHQENAWLLPTCDAPFKKAVAAFEAEAWTEAADALAEFDAAYKAASTAQVAARNARNDKLTVVAHTIGAGI